MSNIKVITKLLGQLKRAGLKSINIKQNGNSYLVTYKGYLKPELRGFIISQTTYNLEYEETKLTIKQSERHS